MKTFLIYSFCKINLSLRVIEKLRTKLHKIQSIVTFVNLFDIIKIKEINSEQDQIKFYGKFKHDIDNDNPLYSEILYKRGVSYERLKLWKKSENDLIQSLNLVPEEPYVLNYLAY